ncbi:hypothetical protein LEP1GSC170_6159 [Leptospira interrogans serovar Bataviae str. HAI135]|nr:hypothetical protein LEP1GSC170_6159 [Leptospira interrogans serovar Bataviae str. HAI135]
MFYGKNLEDLYDIPIQIQKIESTWSVIPKQNEFFNHLTKKHIQNL